MTTENDASLDTPRPPAEPKRGIAARAADYVRAMFSTSLGAGPKRIRLVALAFMGLYVLIGGKLAYLGSKPDPANLRRAAAEAVAAARPDILDRNGEILATDVKVKSIFAEPKRLIDKDEACELLTAALPVEQKSLCDRLASKKGFVWVKREVTQHQSDEVFHLGLPGVGLITENKRVWASRGSRNTSTGRTSPSSAARASA
jgi:cell division protein FtsI (penicillin-binding protein 3)